VIVAIVGWAAIRAISAARARKRARARRDEIDAILEQSAGTTVDEAVESISRGGTKADEVSIEKRFLRLVQPLVVSRADALAFEFMPSRPRAAKRLLNQVRLMISIAIARGLFVLPGSGGEGETNKEVEERQKDLADRVGKWLVLRERWPDVALAAEKDTKLIEALESAARQENIKDLQDCLSSRGISGIEDQDVLMRLLVKEPRFEDISKLALLSTASSTTPRSISLWPWLDQESQ